MWRGRALLRPGAGAPTEQRPRRWRWGSCLLGGPLLADGAKPGAPSGSPVLGTLLLVVRPRCWATVILFLILQPLLGTVFNGLAGRTRGEAGSPARVTKQPFLASVGRALVHGLLKLILYALALVVGLALGAVTAGVGSVVGCSWAPSFWPMTGSIFRCRGAGPRFGAKWRYLALHPRRQNHRIWSRGNGLLPYSLGFDCRAPLHRCGGHPGLPGDRGT